MQIKKFEARTMKEALEMVKTQLGPDAIILSAREVIKGFGLGGEKSIEITAAYSEKILQTKKFVESKMPEVQKEKFNRIPAKSQKEVMKRMIEQQVEKINAQHQRANQSKHKDSTAHSFTQRRYIDIDNEKNSVSSNIPASIPVTQVAQKAWNDMEVNSLKNEIESLKKLVGQFKNIPQNFVQGHPGAEFGIHYEMSPYYKNLISQGLLPEIAADIIAQAQKQIPRSQLTQKSTIEGWIARYILDTTPIVNHCDEQFHLFFGPSGAGKTSMLVKLASDLLLNQGKRVAIISADTMKVGAVEQMKIFSQILNVPFLTMRSQQDWAHLMPYLDQIDHILVDTTGLNLRTADEVNYLSRLIPSIFHSVRKHLVLSCTTKDSDLIEIAQRFNSVGFDDAIFTDLDKATQHGNIYNFIRKVKTELFAFGIGPKVPEDFERATAERVADLILKITRSQAQEVQL